MSFVQKLCHLQLFMPWFERKCMSKSAKFYGRKLLPWKYANFSFFHMKQHYFIEITDHFKRSIYSIGCWFFRFSFRQFGDIRSRLSSLSNGKRQREKQKEKDFGSSESIGKLIRKTNQYKWEMIWSLIWSVWCDIILNHIRYSSAWYKWFWAQASYAFM